MNKTIRRIAMLLCILFLACSCASRSDGDSPPDIYDPEQTPSPPAPILLESENEENEPIDSSFGFLGVWKAVDFLPNMFLLTGMLQPHKYLSMARDALDKEIEYQSGFYRFDTVIFTDIEYILKNYTSDDYDESELWLLLEKTSQSLDKANVSSIRYVYVNGVDNDGFWAEEPDDGRLPALTALEFVMINDDCLYQVSSGLLCERIG